MTEAFQIVDASRSNEEDSFRSFAQAKVALIRMRLGLSQAELVKALKYKDTPLYAAQISNFEQGKREPPLGVLLAYARLAGVSVESLIDDKMKLP